MATALSQNKMEVYPYQLRESSLCPFSRPSFVPRQDVWHTYCCRVQNAVLRAMPNTTKWADNASQFAPPQPCVCVNVRAFVCTSSTNSACCIQAHVMSHAFLIPNPNSLAPPLLTTPFSDTDKATSIDPSGLFVAPVTAWLSMKFIPCFFKLRWNVLEMSMSMPKPPMWPMNSTTVTLEPKRPHTEP